jgi:hypothetical protein
MSKEKLPAGNYYIGDPCYVISDWDSFCQTWFNEEPGIFDFDGYDVCVFNTQYGDGSYKTNDGSWLPVDAGLIGAIPEVLMTRGGAPDGMMVSFAEPFSCGYDSEGTLQFGHVTVQTGDVEDDEE